MNTKYIKWFGMLGAFFSGVAQIASGDIINGTGIIAASLTSAGIFAQAK